MAAGDERRRGWRAARGLAALWLAVAWLLGGAGLASAEPSLERLERDGFAHYTLALTWHPGFCESRSRPPRECREPALRHGAEEGFVLHGLWPSLPSRFRGRGTDRRRWWREGCFLEQPQPDGGFCRAHPPLALSKALGEALDAAMPGRASCLDRYQFAKHAACLSLPETDYFAAAVTLVERVNASAFVDYLMIHRGGEVARNDLIHAFEAAFGTGTGRALRLECGGRGHRLLTEIRLGIDAEALGDFPAADSLVRLGRGRCAGRVRIADFD
ncbi:ribonuclease T2 family protein [Halomonas cerina]|uniref:Ribonuclease I n=1 Tax=Halomonas cerina TaxID=447424 RepID=A0A839VA12_9GAMM|nr:ribonuclease I [Halomonas cerina]